MDRRPLIREGLDIRSASVDNPVRRVRPAAFLGYSVTPNTEPATADPSEETQRRPFSLRTQSRSGDQERPSVLGARQTNSRIVQHPDRKAGAQLL